jgi:hypothetical protein
VLQGAQHTLQVAAARRLQVRVGRQRFALGATLGPEQVAQGIEQLRTREFLVAMC